MIDEADSFSHYPEAAAATSARVQGSGARQGTSSSSSVFTRCFSNFLN